MKGPATALPAALLLASLCLTPTGARAQEAPAVVPEAAHAQATGGQAEHDPHAHHAPPAPRARGAREYFTDVVLVDQHGEQKRLFSDLIENKVVLINSMFTSCTGSCPAMAGRMLKVQEWLGERLGRDVHMISVSVDPENDTPERMKEFADRFGARPGWYFLTGDRDSVSVALNKIGQYVDDPETHMSVMVAGNEATGLWKKVFGLAKPDEIITALESVLKDDGGAG